MAIASIVDARLERLEDVVEEAARVIFSGGVVIFPSDTSYGIGCDPYRSDAIDRIYGAKGRPDNKPLTLQLATTAEFLELTDGNPLVMLAAKRLLPGPVTCVVRRPAFISDELTAGLATIGLRVPDEPLARALLERCGPLAVSSANPSGGVPYRGSGDNSMLPSADLLIENGPTRYELESAIIDLTGAHAQLLREGNLSIERLSELLGPVERHTVKVRSA